jgi:lipopolysaccharide transport system ATP-binding protein
MTAIIKAEHLSKRYSIGARPQHNSLRDALMATIKAPLQRLRNGNASETIWALKDVSFDVEQGEVVGIIGRNGAGKSTLLKILSRVTKPTKGRVTLNGRVGSLLEVGTGFHAELTGRENIYLNGAILGMSRQEIARKFDEIVAFGETEQFLDTPVKHYSSGMIVRLAFAVAAHLEPEIMIIDEVLAVGDAVFQKKCLGKMDEVARGGRTILFVSHDLTAVNSLCQRALLLHDGSIVKTGSAAEVTAYYLNRENKFYSPITWIAHPGANDDKIRLFKVAIQQGGIETTAIDCRRSCSIEATYEDRQGLSNARFFLIIRNAKGDIIFTTSDYDQPAPTPPPRLVGTYTSSVSLPAGLLKAGSYFVTFGADIKNGHVVFAADDVLQFDVFESADDTQAERHKRLGAIAPVLTWETIPTTIPVENKENASPGKQGSS